MNKQQDEIAEIILKNLIQHNGCLKESFLDANLTKLYGDTGEHKKNRFFVKKRMIEEYDLIKRDGALLMISDNGETAHKIGIQKYLKELHSNQRLDVKLKRLEFWCKILTLINNWKTIMFITIIVTILIVALLKWLLKLLL